MAISRLKKSFVAAIIFSGIFSIYPVSAKAAAPHLSNIVITPSSPTNDTTPIVTGSISADVYGVVVLFHNLSYPDSSADYSVIVTNPTAPSFTTEHDPFSPQNGTAVNTLPEGIYQVSVEVSDDQFNRLDFQILSTNYTIDLTPPIFTSAKFASDTILELTYSEQLQSIDFTRFTSSSFTAAGGSTIVSNKATLIINSLSNTGLQSADLSILPGAARDLAGNFSTENLTNKTIADGQPPIITSIETTKPDGYYRTWEEIGFVVTCSEPVTVDTTTSTPSLQLNSGGSAYYQGGNNTNTLAFKYTVASDHNSSNLDYTAVNDLNLNGSTILDAAGNAAINTLPAVGTIAGNHSIVIDTTSPTVDAGPDVATRTAATLTGTASDAGSGLILVLWSKASGPGTLTFGSPTANTTTVSTDVDGVYTIKFEAFDRAANYASDSMILTWDNNSPIITINNPVNGGLYNSSPITSYSVTDQSITIQTASLDNNPLADFQNGHNFGALNDGWHTLIIAAADTLGNSSFQTSSFLVNSGLMSINQTGRIPGNAQVSINDLANTNLFLENFKTGDDVVLSIGTYRNPLGPAPDGFLLFRDCYEIFPGTNSAVSFPFRLRMYYRQSDLIAADINESDIDGIYYYNTENTKFERYASTGTSTDNVTINGVNYAGFVWADIDHLTPVAAMAKKPAPITAVSSTAAVSATATRNTPGGRTFSGPAAGANNRNLTQPAGAQAADTATPAPAPGTTVDNDQTDNSDLELLNNDQGGEIKGESTNQPKTNYWWIAVVLIALFAIGALLVDRSQPELNGNSGKPIRFGKSDDDQPAKPSNASGVSVKIRKKPGEKPLQDS